MNNKLSRLQDTRGVKSSSKASTSKEICNDLSENSCSEKESKNKGKQGNSNQKVPKDPKRKPNQDIRAVQNNNKLAKNLPPKKAVRLLPALRVVQLLEKTKKHARTSTPRNKTKENNP